MKQTKVGYFVKQKDYLLMGISSLTQDSRIIKIQKLVVSTFSKATHSPTLLEKANSIQVPNPGLASILSNDNRKVSKEDIELVQNLIECCLQLYMNRGEARACICRMKLQ